MFPQLYGNTWRFILPEKDDTRTDIVKHFLCLLKQTVKYE